MGHIQHRNGEALALPIKCIYFVLICVVKAFVREVLVVAVQVNILMVSDLSFFNVVEEVMMSQSEVVEEIHEQEVVIYPSADDVRIWETLDGHSVVIDVEGFIDVEFFLGNLFRCSALTTESS